MEENLQPKAVQELHSLHGLLERLEKISDGKCVCSKNPHIETNCQPCKASSILNEVGYIIRSASEDFKPSNVKLPEPEGAK